MRPSASVAMSRSAIAAASGSCVTITTVWPNSSTAWRSRAEDLGRGLGVQVAGRLVGEHDSGLVHERPGHRDPLLLATGELGGAVRAAVAETDGPDEPLDPLVVGLAARQGEGQDQVLLRRQDGQEVERLEDEAHLVAAQLGELGVAERAQLHAVDDDAAARGLVEPREAVHERRLPGPRRAHDGGEGAAGEPDGDAVEGVDCCLPLAVAAGEVGGGDDVGHDERR